MRCVQREDAVAALVTRSIWVEGWWGAASIARSRQHNQFESPPSGVAPPPHTPPPRHSSMPDTTSTRSIFVVDGKKRLTAQTVVATNPRARRQRPVRGGGGVEMRQAPVGSVGSQFQELEHPVAPLGHSCTSRHHAPRSTLRSMQVSYPREVHAGEPHDGRKIVHGLGGQLPRGVP